MCFVSALKCFNVYQSWKWETGDIEGTVSEWSSCQKSSHARSSTAFKRRYQHQPLQERISWLFFSNTSGSCSSVSQIGLPRSKWIASVPAPPQCARLFTILTVSCILTSHAWAMVTWPRLALLFCLSSLSCPRHTCFFSWSPSRLVCQAHLNPPPSLELWSFQVAHLAHSQALLSFAWCWSSHGILGENTTRWLSKDKKVLYVTRQEFYITQSFWKLPAESKLPSNRSIPFV